MKNDFTVILGGEAGQGVESTGAGFALALARAGLHVFAVPDYHSRIRGGHNFFQVRAKDAEIFSHNETVHLVLALTREAVQVHAGQLVPGGGLVYDTALNLGTDALPSHIRDFGMPLRDIVEQAGGSKLMLNTAAVGAAAGLTGLDMRFLESVIQDNFGGKKGSEIATANLNVACAAHDYAEKHFADQFPFKLEAVEAPRRMLLGGNAAMTIGALAGGCRFMAGYPMTPGSPILEMMCANAAEFGVVTKQTEDEIAAICMAIGAGHAGVRAATPTSGGGFSLMVEALGLAGMTEVPVVVFEVQRPGPSTGLPTRTEQSDLMFVLHASQGEFPRIVLAPGTIEEAFRDGWRAFNLAEKYQCPVIVLSDHFLAASLQTVPQEAVDFEHVTIDRGSMLTPEELDALETGYKRFAFTETGISPRVPFGHPRAVFSAASDEHDEYGHIEEDAENRRRMVEKRMRKLDAARQDIFPPKSYGPAEADFTFVAWGSGYGPVREAMGMLERQGISSNLLHITDVWPFPADAVSEVLRKAKRVVSVEGNQTGQMAGLIRRETGIEVGQQILRYDGRPFSPEFILRALEEV